MDFSNSQREWMTDQVSSLVAKTGLNRAEVAELLVDYTIENLALGLARIVAPRMGLSPDEFETQFIDMLTQDSYDPDKALLAMIREKGADPESSLKGIEMTDEVQKARERAVQDILGEFSPEANEGQDYMQKARRSLFGSQSELRKAAEDYWKQKSDPDAYLSPAEREMEKELEKEVEKSGGPEAFKKWASIHYPEVDWDELEKQALEKERQAERERQELLKQLALGIEKKEKEGGKEQADEPDEGISDAELDAFLDDNPDWAAAIEADPSFREKLKKNPDLLANSMSEAVEVESTNLTSQEKDLLKKLADRVRPGGMKLPEEFFIWRFSKDKEKNPNADVEDFIRSFFEQDPSKEMSVEELLKYGMEKPLSKRRLSELTTFSAQTLTTTSKKIKEKEDIQDPAAMLKYLEPRRQGSKTNYMGTAKVPDWVIDAIEPTIVTSDDFVTDVSDLAAKLMNWIDNPKIRGRIEDEIEAQRAKGKEINVNWDLRDPGRAFSVALEMVAKGYAPKIAEDLVSIIDVALANLDKHLSTTQDEDLLQAVGDGPLDWRAALKRFYDPLVDEVLASHGLSYIMSGTLVTKLKNEIRPLVLKYMRAPDEGSKGQGSLSIGARLFTSLEGIVEEILTNKEMLEALIGTKSRSSMEAPYLVKPSLRKKILGVKEHVFSSPILEAKKVQKKDKKVFTSGSDSVKINKSDTKRAERLFKSKLKDLKKTSTVSDMGEWFKEVSGKQGKASARDLVRLLSYLWG